jgi:hypothetical protein
VVAVAAGSWERDKEKGRPASEVTAAFDIKEVPFQKSKNSAIRQLHKGQ